MNPTTTYSRTSLDGSQQPTTKSTVKCSSKQVTAPLANGPKQQKSQKSKDKTSMISCGDTCTSAATSSSAAAIHEGKMQASFAEQTAFEMKKIVDWYDQNNNAKNNRSKDRTVLNKNNKVGVSQNASLPDNPLACCQEYYKELADATPRKSNTSSNRQEHYDHNLALFPPPTIQRQSHFPRRLLDKPLTDDDHSSTSLPSLGFSPSSSSSESPMVLTKQAQQQHAEVDHVIRNTQYMADVIHQYEQSALKSENVEDSKTYSLATSKKSSLATSKKSPLATTNKSPHTAPTSRRRRQNLRSKDPKSMSDYYKWILWMLVVSLWTVAAMLAWKKWSLANDRQIAVVKQPNKMSNYEYPEPEQLQQYRYSDVNGESYYENPEYSLSSSSSCVEVGGTE